tara:strand:- start:881 stop:1753 length:873 start_codon:yes stop_codon:yes gene_type:complete
MKIIKFFCSFGNSENCKNVYIRLSELENDEKYGKDFIFSIGDNYSHAIILNTDMPVLNIPRENVIGLSFEPPQFLNLTYNFIKYAKKNISKYYIGSISSKDNRLGLNLPEPFYEHYGYQWHLSPPKTIKIKNKIMSIMISDKYMAPGHKYRHILVQEILKTDLPIDIYGRGCKYYKNIDNRLKGIFNEDKELVEDYKFTIAIENFKLPHYFSEKITNPLLYETMPIYLGCKNINNYFPNNVINLSNNLNLDMQLITDICKNPDNYIFGEKIIDTNNIKKKISIKNVLELF